MGNYPNTQASSNERRSPTRSSPPHQPGHDLTATMVCPKKQGSPAGQIVKISNDANISTATIGPSPPRFLSLPPEIRDIIYTHYMSSLPTRVWIKPHPPLSKRTLYPGTLPALCFASKHLWQEATLAFLRRTRLMIEADAYKTQPPLASFLAQFPGNSGFAAVRMLGYPDAVVGYSADYTLRTPSQLIVRCEALQSLLLTVNVYFCVRSAEETFAQITDDDLDMAGMHFEMKSKGDMAAAVGLNAILKCANLRFLKITCQYEHWHYGECGVNFGVSRIEDIFGGLVAAVEEGLRERLGSVRVEWEYVEE
ncbi:hypothetical protein BU26DRAFT_592468 [Trematosphaeria pertusa]|uniref:Uncharacterized protein n=1 Tax=Trematosphaeria pertusa TaxID=390896 RepID=A0A6A6IM86_9PLEO|nr:uncharacterized protein BU26DRAFT_592468 [Trematosphaeria pertusa]KAF2251347.1 hypothetical protein BU26DRAFT_592468 [Trematosphaeria pertusa]